MYHCVLGSGRVTFNNSRAYMKVFLSSTLQLESTSQMILVGVLMLLSVQVYYILLILGCGGGVHRDQDTKVLQESPSWPLPWGLFFARTLVYIQIFLMFTCFQYKCLSSLLGHPVLIVQHEAGPLLLQVSSDCLARAWFCCNCLPTPLKF